MNRKYIIKTGLVLLIISIVLIGISSRGCPKRGKEKKIGSSYEWAGISAPSSLTATAFSSSEIRLSWQDNSNNEDGFEIERKVWAGGIWEQIVTVGADITYYYDTGVLPSTTYYYRIRAFNSLGDRSAYSNQAEFTLIATESWRGITAGEGHTLALASNGTLWSWGWNQNGQVGLGAEAPIVITIPTQVGVESDWSSIAAGYYHTLGIKVNGTLWGWGANESGQLGIEDTTSDRYAPTTVNTDSDWSRISAGANHSVALKTNGTIWSWGLNNLCQLGLGDTITRTTPTQIDSNTDWTTIVAGGSHTLALKTDKTLWAWGWNNAGQLGFRDIDNRYRPNQLGGIPSPHPALTATLVSLNQVDLGWSDTNSEKEFQIWRNGVLFTTLGENVISVSDTTITLDNTYYYRVKAINDVGESFSAGVSLLITNTNVGTFTNTPSFPTGPLDSDWSIITAGYQHTIARKTNMTTWAWGYNTSNQLGLGINIDYIATPTQIGTNSEWVAIAAGYGHSIGVRNNGSIWSWGANQYGQLGRGFSSFAVTRTLPIRIGTSSDWLVPIESGSETNLSVIAVGSYHSLATTTDGNLWVWGRNDLYQLGLGDTVERNSPCPLGSPAPPSSLTVTATSSSEIRLSWSDRSYNESGFKIECKKGNNGSYAQITTTNPNTTDYVDSQLTLGATYYYRIKAYNMFGESAYSNEANAAILGIPSSLIATVVSSTEFSLSWTDTADSEEGFKIERKTTYLGNYEQLSTVAPNVTSYSDISPTGFAPNTTYFYRVRAYNAYGDSGYSNEAGASLSGSWMIVKCGGSHTLGLKNNGTLSSWGYNKFGQLGLGDTISRNTPTQINTLSDWSMAVCGNYHTIALKTDGGAQPPVGTIWSWGNNQFGQLGLADSGTGTIRKTPTQIGTETNWLSATAGGTEGNFVPIPIYGYTLALKNNGLPAGQAGSIWSWGYNAFGQLGLGDTTDRNTPTQVGSDTNWSAVETGNIHTIGLKSDGTIWSWGYNENGALGLGDTNSRITPTQIGAETNWLAATLSGNIDYTEIPWLIYGYTIALKNNGTIWAWGDNEFGELGLGYAGSSVLTPTSVGNDSDWCKISAGNIHVLSYKTNKTIWSWGTNYQGQLGLGDSGIGTERYTPTQIGTEIDWATISAGAAYSCAIKNNGTLWAWGSNGNGQLGLGDMVDRNVPTLVGE